MSTTTDIEKENLEAHVELCAERYKNLEQKLDSLDKRMSTVEEHLLAIRNNISQKTGDNNNSDKTIITIGTAMVAALISTITVLLVNFINK